MTPDQDILQLAGRARKTGLHARLARGPGGTGMARPGAILATGKDALSFFHSQVTNEVAGLAPGQGNYSARVTRTGQLVELFSLHRLPDEGDASGLLLVLDRDGVAPLIEDFDHFLFSDDVHLRDVSGDYRWSTVQGPAAAGVVDTAFPMEGESWGDLAPHAVRPLPGPDGAGAWLVARSLTGDAGFLLAVPEALGDTADRLEERLEVCARAADLESLGEPALSETLDVLRIEAGQVRVGPDTRNRKCILPETGLEQHAVSYTKGCYLGQEVIARVRTYGALPFGLRGLVIHGADAEPGAAARLLEDVPASGGDLELEEGKRIGQWGSSTLSPVMQAPVAFAYLDKAHRTPGSRLRLRGSRARLDAEVVLLPFYHAPGRDERVAYLYDRAIRVFAEGREQEALEILEEALRLDPSFSDGYEAVGVILGRSERFHEAIDIFKRLEELAPSEAMVNTNLSLYYMKIGDKSSAEDESAKALRKSMAAGSGRSEPSDEIEAELLAQQRSDAERKRKMFGQVLEIDPDDPVALFGLGNALAVLEDWEPAVEHYARASTADAGNSAVYLAHGKALEALGREAEAEDVYRAGMEVASRKGDLMPLKEMEHRMLLLAGAARSDPSDRRE